jgi:hypothetical protein
MLVSLKRQCQENIPCSGAGWGTGEKEGGDQHMFSVNLPDILSRDVGLRLCLAMVELIWMDVSSL